MSGGSNQRVVVVFPGALGDFVLAADALAALRSRAGGGSTTLAVNDWLRGVAAVSGVADHVASLDDADAAGLFGGTRVPEWFGTRPELHAWVGARDPLVRAALRRVTASATFHRVVRDDGPEHASRVYLAQVGAGAGPVTPVAWGSPAASDRVRELAGAAPLLIVHAGAGGSRKRWARRGFVDVARRWIALGGAVADVVGPAEHDLEPLAGAHRVEGWPLVEILALLHRATAYVGNDSGLSHLAGVAGVGGVTVFGATPARRWAPHRGRLAVVEAPSPCADGIDVDAVSSGDVWDALARGGCLDKLRGRK